MLRPPWTLLSPAPIEPLVPSIALYICLAVALAGAPAGVLTFGEERAVYFREARAGSNRIAYFLAKNLAVLPRIGVAALHFAGVFCLLATPVTPFWRTFYPLVVASFFAM